MRSDTLYLLTALELGSGCDGAKIRPALWKNRTLQPLIATSLLKLAIGLNTYFRVERVMIVIGTLVHANITTATRELQAVLHRQAEAQSERRHNLCPGIAMETLPTAMMLRSMARLRATTTPTHSDLASRTCFSWRESDADDNGDNEDHDDGNAHDSPDEVDRGADGTTSHA